MDQGIQEYYKITGPVIMYTADQFFRVVEPFLNDSRNRQKMALHPALRSPHVGFQRL
jgi:hypothetical protein